MRNMQTNVALNRYALYQGRPLYRAAKFGEQQTYGVFRYFDNGKKRMMIIYREEAVSQLVDLISAADHDGKMKVYISLERRPLGGEFEEVADKVELCALQAIYNAYSAYSPRRKTRSLLLKQNSRNKS